jgi:hypothetical protein
MRTRLVLYSGVLLTSVLGEVSAAAEPPNAAAGVPSAPVSPAPPTTATPPALTLPSPAKWVQVDCSLSRLTVPHQVKCSRGPLSSSDSLRSRCTYENWSVNLSSNTAFGFVRIMMVSPDSPGRCYIYHGGEPIDLMKKTVRGAETRTRDWSTPDLVKDGYNSAFVNSNNSQCRAFIRNSQSWQGGYRYVMRGFLCGKQGAALSENDLDTLLAAVTIRGTDTMGKIEPNR